jgi:hypothetical protein
MKKTYLTLIPLAVLLIAFCVPFYSCKPEEPEEEKPIEKPLVQEPKLKKVYVQNPNNETKHLMQEWFWDKNILKKIVYYSDNENIEKTSNYFYEKNRLVKVEDEGGSFHISNSNSNYSKIEYYRNDFDVPIATCDFFYENNKVSKIIYTADDDFWVNKITKGVFSPSVIPKEFTSAIESESKRKSENDITITYKYSGDNIEKMQLIISGFVITYTFISYDKMKNPFHNKLQFYYDELYLNELVTSKNNLLEMELYIPFELSGTIKYSYKYEKNMPVEEEQIVTVYDGGSSGNTEVYKTYYEYE